MRVVYLTEAQNDLGSWEGPRIVASTWCEAKQQADAKGVRIVGKLIFLISCSSLN